MTRPDVRYFGPEERYNISARKFEFCNKVVCLSNFLENLSNFLYRIHATAPAAPASAAAPAAPAAASTAAAAPHHHHPERHSSSSISKLPDATAIAA